MALCERTAWARLRVNPERWPVVLHGDSESWQRSANYATHQITFHLHLPNAQQCAQRPPKMPHTNHLLMVGALGEGGPDSGAGLAHRGRNLIRQREDRIQHPESDSYHHEHARPHVTTLTHPCHPRASQPSHSHSLASACVGSLHSLCELDHRYAPTTPSRRSGDQIKCTTSGFPPLRDTGRGGS